MSDHDPEVTPEQEARLRRLLARARDVEPVPDDVAARLDRVLEQLAAEDHDPAVGAAHPVDLAARRRQRVRTLLVAAAAVVVVGVGVGRLVGTSSDDSTTTADATSSAESAGDESAALPEAASQDRAEDSAGAEESAPAESILPDSSDGSASELPGTLYTASPAPSPPVRLTEDGFAAQAERFRDRRGVRSTERSVVPGPSLSVAESFVCDTADWGPGRLLPALYDGVPAVLAYRAVAGPTQTVDLLRCGTGEVLRSIVLPVGD
jgi:hypothetical protein